MENLCALDWSIILLYERRSAIPTPCLIGNPLVSKESVILNHFDVLFYTLSWFFYFFSFQSTSENLEWKLESAFSC